MIKRKKILLGNKDIRTREIEDFQINLNLTRTYNEIVPNKFDNKFDLLKQYNKERNLSRNFRIYGTIESVFLNCDFLYLHIFSKKPEIISENMWENDGYIKTIQTNRIISNAWNPPNIFNKKKGKYLIELENYSEFDSIYIFISGLETNYKNLFKIQLVYRYEMLNIMGNKTTQLIPYGKEEAVVDINGNILPISNDFDFFYNKHWVKKNINLDYKRETFWTPSQPYCLTVPREKIWYPDETSTTCVIEPYTYGVLSFSSLTLNVINETSLEKTGFKKYENLIEVFANTLTPIPNASYKENLVSNSDYVPNVFDNNKCTAISPKSLTIVNDTDIIGYEPGEGYTRQTALVTGGTIPVSPYEYKTSVLFQSIPGYNSVFLGFDEYTTTTINSSELYYTFDFNKLTGETSSVIMTGDTIYRAKFAKAVVVTIQNITCEMLIVTPLGMVIGRENLNAFGTSHHYSFPKNSEIRIFKITPSNNAVKVIKEGEAYTIKHFVPQSGVNIDGSMPMARIVLDKNVTIRNI